MKTVDSSIDKLIRKYIIEIIVVVFIMIFSYGIFTSASLSSASLVARSYEGQKYNVYVMYGRTSQNSEDIGTKENLLDRGELTLKNPNEQRVATTSFILFKNDENLDLSRLHITIDDKEVDTSIINLVDEYCEIKLDSGSLNGYETTRNTISIYGDPLNTKSLDYTFKVIESFYE